MNYGGMSGNTKRDGCKEVRGIKKTIKEERDESNIGINTMRSKIFRRNTAKEIKQF